MPLYEIARGIKQRRGDILTPVIVRDAASEPMATYLAEHARRVPRRDDRPAYVRHYPYQDLASQVLGYVGSITQAQLDARSARATT